MSCLAGYDSSHIATFTNNLVGFFQNNMYQDPALITQLRNVFNPKLLTDLKNLNQITQTNLTSNMNFIRTRLQNVIDHFSA